MKFWKREPKTIMVICLKSGQSIEIPVKSWKAKTLNGEVKQLSWTHQSDSKLRLQQIDVCQIEAILEKHV